MLGEMHTRSGWIGYKELEAEVDARGDWNTGKGYLSEGMLDEGKKLIRQEVENVKGGCHSWEVSSGCVLSSLFLFRGFGR